MAATVIIRRYTSTTGSPTTTDITSTTNRASTSDDPAPGTSNPIPVPTTGTPNYSYWVATRLSATAGATTAINTIRWYTDGGNSMGTGVTLAVATCSTYVQAIGTTGTSGSALSSATYNSALSPSVPEDAFGKTSAAPISVAGSIGTGTGPFGDFVVYQVAVASTAGPGTTTAETITWQFDET